MHNRSLKGLLSLAVILFLSTPCWAQQEQVKTVQLEARIEADEDEALVEDTEVGIRRSGTRLELRTDYEKAKEKQEETPFFGLISLGGSYSLPFVHYTIRMPRTARLVIDDYKSVIQVDDLQADAQIETYKGEVHVARQEGDLELQTYKGEVVFRLPAEAGFLLNANIVDEDGALPSDFPLPGLRYGERTYEGAVNGGGPKLRFETYRGRLALRKG